MRIKTIALIVVIASASITTIESQAATYSYQSNTLSPEQNLTPPAGSFDHSTRLSVSFKTKPSNGVVNGDTVIYTQTSVSNINLEITSGSALHNIVVENFNISASDTEVERFELITNGSGAVLSWQIKLRKSIVSGSGILTYSFNASKIIVGHGRPEITADSVGLNFTECSGNTCMVVGVDTAASVGNPGTWTFTKDDSINGNPPITSIEEYDAEGNGVTFFGTENLLNIPLANVNGRYIANAKLKLEPSGQFVVKEFKEIPDNQQAIVKKLQNLPCGKADTLGRWAAYNTFLKGNENYCLVKTIPINKTEIAYAYLLVDNGTILTIEDTRNEIQCCFKVNETGGETQVKFGYQENGQFIEETELNEIDFEREYQLRLIGNTVLMF